MYSKKKLKALLFIFFTLNSTFSLNKKNSKKYINFIYWFSAFTSTALLKFLIDDFSSFKIKKNLKKTFDKKFKGQYLSINYSTFYNNFIFTDLLKIKKALDHKNRIFKFKDFNSEDYKTFLENYFNKLNINLDKINTLDYSFEKIFDHLIKEDSDYNSKFLKSILYFLNNKNNKELNKNLYLTLNKKIKLFKIFFREKNRNAIEFGQLLKLNLSIFNKSNFSELDYLEKETLIKNLNSNFNENFLKAAKIFVKNLENSDQENYELIYEFLEFNEQNPYKFPTFEKIESFKKNINEIAKTYQSDKKVVEEFLKDKNSTDLLYLNNFINNNESYKNEFFDKYKEDINNYFEKISNEILLIIVNSNYSLEEFYKNKAEYIIETLNKIDFCIKYKEKLFINQNIFISDIKNDLDFKNLEKFCEKIFQFKFEKKDNQNLEEAFIQENFDKEIYSNLFKKLEEEEEEEPLKKNKPLKINSIIRKIEIFLLINSNLEKEKNKILNEFKGFLEGKYKEEFSNKYNYPEESIILKQ